MKAKLALSAAAVLLLASCASTAPTTTASNGATAGKATYYCQKEQLYAEADGFACNWETSIAAACASGNTRKLAKSAIAGTPRGAGMCKTGEWLVSVPAA